MKTIILFICFFVTSLSTHATPAGDLGLTPSSLKLKVYKFAVSTSPLCTNLMTVIDNGNSPQEVEFIGSVQLGSGVLASGTYPCVVIEMSDNIKYIPGSNSSSGSCVASTEYILDVCRTQGMSVYSSQLIDGSITTCSSGVADDRVAMFMSTGSPGTGDSFYPPSAVGVGDGFNLASPLVVSGSTVAQFVVNPAGKMCDNANDTGSDCDGAGASVNCQLEAPVFNFEY